MTHAALACVTLVLAATAGVAARGEDTPPRHRDGGDHELKADSKTESGVHHCSPRLQRAGRDCRLLSSEPPLGRSPHLDIEVVYYNSNAWSGPIQEMGCATIQALPSKSVIKPNVTPQVPLRMHQIRPCLGRNE